MPETRTSPTQAQLDQVESEFRHLMISREGYSEKVYPDSRSLATVGIGHLVVTSDHLKLGDTITPERVNEIFKSDSTQALATAWRDAEQAGITSLSFIPYLASVAFQLGTDWTSIFHDTWKLIVNGSYTDAANALTHSRWAHQTPTRVTDFQLALRALPPKPSLPLQWA